MSRRKPRRDGIIHQIQHGKVSPAPEGTAMPTVEQIEEMLTDIGRKNKELAEGEGSFDFYETYKHLMDKSREELEQIIPNGMYNIGTGDWMVLTGKGGLIEAIVTFNDRVKEAWKQYPK